MDAKTCCDMANNVMDVSLFSKSQTNVDYCLIWVK